MHDHDSSGREEASAADVDRRLEFGVLDFLLGEHPAQLTEAELARARAGGPRGFDDTDAVERALDEMTGAGLVRRQGEAVVPTRAARHFAWLEEAR